MWKKLRPFLYLYLGFVVCTYIASYFLRQQIMDYENDRIAAWAKVLNDKLARKDHLEELDPTTMDRIGFNASLVLDLEVASSPTLDDYRL